jgi:hypothetical protein
MKPTTMIAVLLLVACGDNELSRVDVEVFYPLAVADVLATMQVGSVLVAPKEGSCADAPQQAATISTGEPLAVANTNIRLPAAGFEGGEACLGTRMWDGNELNLIGATDGKFDVAQPEGMLANEEVLELVAAEGQALSRSTPIGGCSSKTHILGFGNSGAWLFSARGRTVVEVPPIVACSTAAGGFEIISRDPDGNHQRWFLSTAGEVEERGSVRAVPAMPSAHQATTADGITVHLDVATDALVFRHPNGAIDDRGRGSARGNQSVFVLDSGIVVLANRDGRIDVTRSVGGNP